MPEPQPITCPNCGQPFSPNTPRVRYCSYVCRRAYERKKPMRKRCVQCGNEYTGTWKRDTCSDECLRLSRSQAGVLGRKADKGNYCRPYYWCGWCGKRFTPKASNRTHFCSRGCSFASRRKTQAEADALAAIRNNWRWRLFKCEWCLEVYETRLPYVKYCSKECRASAQRRRAIDVYVPARWRNVHQHKTCAECGKGFISQTYSAVRKYCSERCRERVAKRASNHRRRVAARTGHAQAIPMGALAKRDNWRCALCGKRVRMDKNAPHPLSATIDHIIPLSQGGRHEWRNVQLAHFVCNSRKGDRPCGSQLILVGEV
jgi:5-methylcytosine-specific restriction endonuclease McrA